MTLAEANVAPGDVLKFFGDGNRMNLLFNFWANQHLFLAVATEDAGPWRKAYEQLPDLPPTAQWANLLSTWMAMIYRWLRVRGKDYQGSA